MTARFWSRLHSIDVRAISCLLLAVLLACALWAAWPLSAGSELPARANGGETGRSDDLPGGRAVDWSTLLEDRRNPFHSQFLLDRAEEQRLREEQAALAARLAGAPFLAGCFDF